MTQWIAYVPTGQEFALVEDCEALGVEAFAPCKVEAVRTGNKRWPEKRVMPEDLHKYLSYEPETGGLFWRPRDGAEFKSKRAWSTWMARFAGAEAGGKTAGGYLLCIIFGQRFYAHRAIWAMQTGKWPDADIDHVNGDRSDNRWANLRQATRSQNLSNKGASARNTSGFKGASFNKASGLWVAQIGHKGKNIYLGHFKTPEEAHEAYVEASARLHGEFGRTA